jgi:pantothenate kinase type III
MILVVDVGNTKLKLLFFGEYPLATFCFVDEELEKY